jgi:general nucleoside transport system ATP-binding protein
MVRMASITKRYGELVASNGVDLGLYAGEVHAVLGENGAGKTTLMKILSGTTTADEGDVLIHGERVNIRSPRDALAYGIGMVHQDYRLVRNLTVAENLYLGFDAIPRRIGKAQLSRIAAAAIADWDWPVDVDAHVSNLAIGQQQRVAILRSLIRGAKVLILDEPTAVLSPDESQELFASLRSLAASGAALVFISHKLTEVLEVSDRITVLRGGSVVGRLPTHAATEDELVRLMVGQEVTATTRERSSEPGPVVLRAVGLTATGTHGEVVVDDVSIEVRKGEILGVAGVSGNGQRELSEILAGMRRTTSGSVEVADQTLTPGQTRRFLEAGVRHIPEDRATTGLVLDESITRNAIMRDYRTSELSRGSFLRRRPIRKHALALMERAAVRGKSGTEAVRHLSGGNRQRLLTGRELNSGAEVLIAVHPTQGIDVSAAQAIHDELRATRDAGKGIVLISEDLDEILDLSDRVVVIYEGRIRGEFRPGESGARAAIGRLMGGLGGDEAGGRRKKGAARDAG